MENSSRGRGAEKRQRRMKEISGAGVGEQTAAEFWMCSGLLRIWMNVPSRMLNTKDSFNK